MIAARCCDLASLLPGLAISVEDQMWCYDDGIVDRVRDVSSSLDPFHVRTTVNGIAIDVALAWTSEESTWLRTYVNCSLGDGTHSSGLFAGLASVLGRRLQSRKQLRKRIERGLVGMLHVRLDDPKFGNPTRDWLENPEVGASVREVVEREFTRYLDETPAVLDTLLMQLDVTVRSAPSRRRRSKPRTPS
jgi:DNA gyrase subunit B